MAKGRTPPPAKAAALPRVVPPKKQLRPMTGPRDALDVTNSQILEVIDVK